VRGGAQQDPKGGSDVVGVIPYRFVQDGD